MAEISIEKMAQNAARIAMQELRGNGVFIGRWIPVSESLPVKGKQVLCCNKQGSVFTSAITYRNAYMIAYGMITFGQHCDVIAWMPLPEPYEPQESEVSE